MIRRKTPKQREERGGGLATAASSLAEFLRSEGSRIVRLAIHHERVAVPDSGSYARRRLKKVFRERVAVLGRLLDSYGESGVRLFGEMLRARAAELANAGLGIQVLLDEQAAFHQALVDVWANERGALPAHVSRLLSDILSESMLHASDVWVRRRRIEGDAFREVALLQIVVESLDEAIMVFEVDGTVSFVTEALERVAGVSPMQVVDVPADDLLGVIASLQLRDPQGRRVATHQLPWRRALLAGQAIHEEALHLRRPDTGREGVVELYANPVRTEDGRLRGVIVTLRDRTERHRVFLELEQSYSDLRRMHQRMLTRSHLETVGTLVQGAVHALNNQLNVLMMKARHVQDKTGHEGAQGALMLAAQEMAGVLERLQNFAQPPYERPPVPVSLADAVRETRALTHAEFGPTSAVRLVTKLPPLPDVLAQPELLVELLTSVVLIARDLAAGGHRLHLEAERQNDEIEVSLRAGGRKVGALNGKSLERPAESDDENRLALPTVKELLERWGGRLIVGDPGDEGRLVSLVFKIAPRTRPQPEEERRQAAEPVRNPTVLVVDDDRDNAEVLTEVLHESGLEARTVFSGTQAIVDAEEHAPDVVFLDLHLPDMPGWDVARELKERHPSVRIAVVSGLATPGAPEEREVDAVFRKPVDASRLVDFVYG